MGEGESEFDMIGAIIWRQIAALHADQAAVLVNTRGRAVKGHAVLCVTGTERIRMLFF
jgi:hypothetical protein